ncbi:T9SS type B sorting domain-containing protein [Brumimicrobium oceani]|uniref:PKD domain-containing protein n=1 Tax=Brumimicrobium oceani TaxID=2100725 RepID=A0A2U2X0Y4_9FLAO|nr:gliding motility-associated C-terminal domain-containing protein [Brumimicrobium oceani]PWH81438.1 hypothetical protein DIT68_14995 [Brumimicrobium oceani]
MKKIILFIATIFTANFAISQCDIDINTATTSIDCGNTFVLTAVGTSQISLLDENFNNSTLASGWIPNQPVMFSNPCGAPPDGSPSAWFGNSQPHPRFLETTDYDVTCGGDICFMMKYATQGGSGSCEGPELTSEGVDLQYSLNSGATWVSIAYHPPLNGGYDAYQTTWNQYCYAIPAAAQTTSTRFRWIQGGSHGANNDHWGIDDVLISALNCAVYYYDWAVDGTQNTADTVITQSVNSKTYNVIYTNGIDDTCSASITIDASLSPDFDYFAPCEGEQVTFTNISTGPFTNAKWIFLNGTDTIQAPSATYTFPPGSNMDVELYIEDSVGSCTGTVTKTVVETPKLQLSVDNQVDVTCNEGEDGIVTVGVSEGTSPYTYSWSNSVSTGATADDLAFGPTTVTVVDSNGCTISETVNIDQPEPLVISNVSPDTVICIDDPVDLFAVGSGGSTAYIYEWSENGQVVANGSNVTVTPTSASTEYMLVLSEQCGSPQDTAYVTVNYPDELIPALTPDITGGCYPVAIDFTNSTNTNEVIDYTVWDYTDGNIDTIAGSGNAVHEFDLGVWGVNMEIVSERGCRYFRSYTDLIEGYPYPEANFYVNPNPVSIFESTVTAYGESSGDIVSYQWFAEEADPDYSSIQNPTLEYPSEIKNYPLILVVENGYGCTDTIQKLVRVENVVTIFTANTFTPDGDGLNDTWKPNLLGIDTQNFRLEVFNRWGETVFESQDPDGEWDGTYGGKLVKAGTYMWVIRVNDFENDNKHEFNGSVNVLR